MSRKDRILQPEVSLTDLVADAVEAKASELRRALEEARREADYEALVAAKKQLAQEGRASIDTMLTQIEHGGGTGIIVYYQELGKPKVAMGFTPFGITVVDHDRTIYAQVPIQARFADGSEVAQTEPLPLLHEKKVRLIRFRLPRELTPEEVTRATASGTPAGQEVHELKLELPGVVVSSASAMIQQEGKDLRIVLKPPRK